MSDGGCHYSGSVKIANVPQGYKAVYFDDASKQTLTGCSGQEIGTAEASFYTNDGGCVSSPPPVPAGPPTTTAPAPTPPSGGSGCPSFGGIATSPLNDGTGGCKLALQSTNVSGTVPSGWKMVYWNGSANAEAGPGSTVEVQEGTLYPA
jgi:hypothetical protein